MSDAQITRMMDTTAHLVPDEDQIERIVALRGEFTDLIASIGVHLPEPTRERSIALTKLEEARMYAVFAVVAENA